MAYVTKLPILDIDHVWVSSMRNPDYDTSLVLKGYFGYYTFDPSRSLVNQAVENSWVSGSVRKNQRIWADIGSSCVIARLYYENYHDTPPPDTFNPALVAGDIQKGAYEGSIWGSNTRPGSYGNYSGLTQLWEGQFSIHSNNNASDPHYIYFTNTIPFQYYTVDINENYSENMGMGFRRLEFQEDV